MCEGVRVCVLGVEVCEGVRVCVLGVVACERGGVRGGVRVHLCV